MSSPKKQQQQPRRRRGRKSNDGDASDYKGHTSVLIQLDEDKPTWHQYAEKIKECNAVIDGSKTVNRSSSDVVSKYRSLGDMIYQNELRNFNQSQEKGSDERWVESTIRKGTLKDRIAAMSVTVGSNVIHKLYALDGLFQMVGCSVSGGKTNSRVAQMTAEALDDLFLTMLLPDRKLYNLSDRPLHLYEQKSKTLSPRVLLLWRYEEILKEKFDIYRSKYMGATLRDGVDTHKVSVIRSAANFLRSIPEAESDFLAMIVNKLGDPAKKTASAAGHELGLVLLEHPNMQTVIAREVQQLAHRPNLSPRALYNCITFLNQLRLSNDDDDGDNDDGGKDASGTKGSSTDRDNSKPPEYGHSLPTSLIKTYFRLFEVAIHKANAKKEPGSSDDGMKSRLLSALLTGVNRAYPYLPKGNAEMENHIDALYRIVHTAAPSACTQALLLLFQVVIGQSASTTKPRKSSDTKSTQDRFYRTVYTTLSHQTLLTNGKHLTMYFNLLYKAMKYDVDSSRVSVFAKRILATAMHESSSVVAGSLFLVNEVSKTHSELKTFFEDVPAAEDSKLVLDPSKRDPRFALSHLGKEEKHRSENEENERIAPSWELSLLIHHFHPSVHKFAGSLGELSYAGDPIKDFGLVPFLDKFSYRNPKSATKMKEMAKRRGKSIAQRRFDTSTEEDGLSTTPMNHPSFLQQDDVSEQDEFFHKFFKERARRDEIKGIARQTPDEEQQQERTEDDLEDAENAAMDIAEGMEGYDAVSKYEEYEKAWKFDAEEEAFVDELALQMIEDSAAGQADFDDEDPDMEDWGDIGGDTKDGSGGVGDGDGQGSSADDDDDDENDDADSSDDDDSESDRKEKKISADQSGDMDDFMDDSNDDSDASPNQEEEGEENDDDDDDVDDGSDDEMPFFGESDDDSDGGVTGNGGPFADADEYEAMVSEGWRKLKRSKPGGNEHGNDDNDDDDNDGGGGQETVEVKKSKKKRKKSKK